MGSLKEDFRVGLFSDDKEVLLNPLEDGELIASSKGLHLYDYCCEIARAVARLED